MKSNSDGLTRGDDQSKSSPGGLAAMHKAGSVIAFACAPGAVADDRKDDDNSLFAKHLAKYITTPNEDILSILIDVTREVMKDSDSKQTPFVNFQLTHKKVYLCQQSQGNDRTFGVLYEELL